MYLYPDSPRYNSKNTANIHVSKYVHRIQNLAHKNKRELIPWTMLTVKYADVNYDEEEQKEKKEWTLVTSKNMDLTMTNYERSLLNI